jgi:hypothetical protein
MSQVRLTGSRRAAGSVSKQLLLGPLTYRARAWECAARAQVLSDPERRLEFLRLAGMWLSLTEPIEDDPAGACEVPPKAAA